MFSHWDSWNNCTEINKINGHLVAKVSSVTTVKECPGKMIHTLPCMPFTFIIQDYIFIDDKIMYYLSSYNLNLCVYCIK